MKDKHNIILILVSSKWLILSFRVCSGGINSWLLVVHLSSGVLSFPHYLVTEIHLNHCKDSPCVFNFSFFLSSFCYRSSSWRRYMMVLKGFNSFSKCSSRFFLEELKHSSSCISKSNSFYLIFCGGIMSFLIIWVHVSWFTCC